MTLREIQIAQNEWATRNFGEQEAITQFLGVVEEVGELAHSILKQQQCIRGSHEEHEAKARDAVGDIAIFLLGYCNRRGWDLQAIIDETWAEVSKRDWTNKKELPNGDMHSL